MTYRFDAAYTCLSGTLILYALGISATFGLFYTMKGPFLVGFGITFVITGGVLLVFLRTIGNYLCLRLPGLAWAAVIGLWALPVWRIVSAIVR